MKNKAIIIVIFILLSSSLAYSDEYSYSYSSSSESHNYGDIGVGFERYKESEKFEDELPDDFKGPGGCKSPKECMEYCKDHEDECGRMMKYEGKMHQGVEAEFKEPSMMKKKMMHPMMFFPKDMDPLEIAMGRIFDKAKGMDPKEFMKYCPDAEKMVDEAIRRLKEQNIELKASCDELNEHLKYCKEDYCKKMKEGVSFEDDFSCSDLSEERLFEQCMEKHEKFNQNEDFARERCLKEFESYSNADICQLQGLCNEQEFLQNCQNENQQRCNEQGSQNGWTQEAIQSCIDSHDCNSAWNFHEQNCEARQDMCDRDKFLEKCIGRSEQAFESASDSMEENCRMQVSMMLEKMKEVCSMHNRMQDECIQRQEESCRRMEDAISKCKDITEDQIRARMIERARFMCDIMGKMPEEGMEGIMARMMMMKEDMPEDMQIVMDAEAKKLYDIDKELESGEKEVDSFFNKIKRFLGIISEKEKEEASELEQNANKIDESIQSLTELSEQVTDSNLKAALILQIEKLKEEKEKIKNMAEKKKKGGLLRFFTGAFAKFEL